MTEADVWRTDDLLPEVVRALERVRGTDCLRGRDDVMRLANRWAARQDRADAALIARRLDGWAAQLNTACRTAGGAGPVTRLGARLYPVSRHR